LKEIHVAGKKLQLNSDVFDGKHGTVLDSGTTYAYLPEAAFLAFKRAVSSFTNIIVECSELHFLLSNIESSSSSALSGVELK
jgi:hypothetical protein